MADSSFLSASSAYRSALQTLGLDKTAGIGPQSESAPVQEFSSVLRDAVQGAVEIQRKGEAVSLKAIANEADLTELVTAVSNAEVTLETVIGVRDKIISAYQEIIRMPV